MIFDNFKAKSANFEAFLNFSLRLIEVELVGEDQLEKIYLGGQGNTNPTIQVTLPGTVHTLNLIAKLFECQKLFLICSLSLM